MHRILKSHRGLLIFILFALIVIAGVYTYNLKQKNLVANDIGTDVIDLSGTISSLHVREWGIKTEFKDADKVKYLPSDTSSNRLKLFARGVALPSNSCSDLGIALIRSSSEPVNIENTKAGSYFYYFEKGHSSCDINQPDNEQSRMIKEKIISSAFVPGAYTITEL